MVKGKIITLCGSLKYQKEMMITAEKLELASNCVLTVIYPIREDKESYTKEEKEVFDQMHYKKIDLSDAIFVVDVDGYIGESTKKEIAYATSLGKEILYWSKERGKK